MAKAQHKKRKILSLILYLLPIIFFASSYFLMITSGEDVHQGANREPNIISNAVSSFKWSARASDVYQRVFIKFYTYTSFEGSFSNLVFRAIDVVLAALMLYLALFYVLRRRPKLEIKDALLFNSFFLILIFSVHARVLYRGFSLINNYLIIGVSTLLFYLPFIKEIYHRHQSKWLFTVWMLLAGILFGISHNITPIIFLLSYLCYLLYLRFVEKNRHPLKDHFAWWKLTAVVGVIIGVAFCYLIGPGVSGYSDGNYAQMYDYVSFSDLVHNPAKNGIKVVGHMVSNFKSIMKPLYSPIILGGTVVLYAKRRRKIRFEKWTLAERRVIIVLSLFMALYWLAMSQVQNLTRLYFPANITGIIIVLYVFYHYFKSFEFRKIGPKFAKIATLIIAGLSIFVICERTAIAIDYYRTISPELARIKNSSESELCVESKYTRERDYPIDDFVQEPTFEDWVMPEEIYGKTITICE